MKHPSWMNLSSWWKWPLRLVAFLLAAAWSFGEDGKPVLRVLNWSSYIAVDSADETLPLPQRSPALRGFAAKEGCRVEYYEYAETAEAMSRVGKSLGFYDLVILSSNEVERMAQAGYLLRLDWSQIPNRRYLPAREDGDPLWGRSAWDYAAPYLYGTTGLAYRRDRVSELEASDWATYFEPSPARKGRIGVLNDPQVMYGLAKLYGGLDPNSGSFEDYRVAARALHGLKDGGFVGLVSSDVERLQGALLSGDLDMAVMYSGDVNSLLDENPNIGYSIPRQGAEFFVDSFAVLEGGKNRELAHRFIDYMLEPAVNAQNASSLKYATPHRGALEILRRDDPQQLANPGIYPTALERARLREFNDYSSWQSLYWQMFLNED